MIRARGYAFVTLENALADSVHGLPARLTGPGGLPGAEAGPPAYGKLRGGE